MQYYYVNWKIFIKENRKMLRCVRVESACYQSIHSTFGY